MKLLTLGHSNRTLAELVELASSAGIRVVADVRRFPRSRRHPWFDAAALDEGLARAGIARVHFPDLGGHRSEPPPDAHAPVAGLEPPWRGYAAHARTEGFAGALESLLELARRDGPLALLCAEKRPASCHRSLLADVLCLRGHEVLHVVDEITVRPHALHPLARLEDGRPTYRRAQRSLF